MNFLREEAQDWQAASMQWMLSLEGVNDVQSYTSFSGGEVTDEDGVLETRFGERAWQVVVSYFETYMKLQQCTYVNSVLPCIEWVTFIAENKYIKIGVISEN